jgi:hypothetical protein
MKKEYKKVWAVGLALVLAVSLIFSAAPVSAGTLSWGAEDLPEELDWAGDVVDIAVSSDGNTIYIADGSSIIYRSTNGGETWTEITVIANNIVMAAEFIAVAPDDGNYIAVTSDNSTDPYVYISDDAGANWDSLGQVATATDTAFEDVRDLALSMEKSGNHFVAVAGTDNTSAEVWDYEIGAVGAAWAKTSGDSGFTAGQEAGAVAFSPNFASDQVMVAVTETDSAAIYLQIYSFNQGNWNSGAFADYPAKVVEHNASDAVVDQLDSAAIAMSPEYLGSDDDLRVLFVTTTTDNSSGSEDEADGIFRMDDDDVTELKVKKFMHSVAFNGTDLVAGRYHSTGVYYTADPLASSPTVSSSTSTKNPGGEGLCVVAFAGAEVVAGTSGDESAFAVSADDGKTFNDLSMIDTLLTTISDVAVSPDGSEVFLVTADNETAADLSLWRYASRWERVYSERDAGSSFIVRMAPDDSDMLYLAEVGDTTIYFSREGGETKWFTRTARYSITDLAVEGDGDVVYEMTDFGYVSKSSNTGFTWDSKVASKLTGGSEMLLSLGEDLLIAGSTDGYVAYSDNGNVTWTKLDDDLGDAVQVVATGLEDGDFVIAASSANNSYIYQWELGEDDEWDTITDDDFIGTGYGVFGLAMEEGVLYAVSSNGTDSKALRTLTPTDEDPSWSTMASAGEDFVLAPKALKVSRSDDITKLWAIDNEGPALFSYKDTLATAAPASSGPRDGATIDVNPVTGRAYTLTFSWKSPSDSVTEYDLVIALDSGFDETVLDEAVADTADEGEIVSQVVGPYASSPFDLEFMAGTTYYWKVRVDLASPVRSAYSEVRSFTVAEAPEPAAPVVIEQPPAPVISVPPTPEITITPPEIVIPPQPDIVLPAPEVTLPPTPAPVEAIPAWALYVIIIIGAILVIALIVLIMRTRRPV